MLVPDHWPHWKPARMLDTSKSCLGVLSYDDIQPLAKAALEFRSSILFEQVVLDITGIHFLDDELQGFVAVCFINTETLCDYAKSLQANFAQQAPGAAKVVNALPFFFSAESAQPIDHSHFTQHYLLRAQLKKLQQQYERRETYTFD